MSDALLDLDLDRNREKPVYKQIEDQIREKILRGELPAGHCLPNGQELSAQFGVAYRTVIRSLNTLKKQGLLRGIPSRGTFVQAVPHRRVQNIAITFDRNYQQDIAREVERFQRGITAACADHLHLQIFPLHDATIFSKDEPTLLARLIEDWHIHGVITYSAAPLEDIKRLTQLRIPTVTTRDIYPDTGVPYVMEDVADGAKKLVRYVVGELGHRNIGLVMGPQPTQRPRVIRPSALLAQALQQELKAAGPAVSAHRVLYTDFRFASVAAPLKEWLTSANRPTALIFAADTLAMEAISLAQSLGLSVPKDLSIASYGDLLSTESSLTAIHLPIEKMALRSVDYLEQLTQGKQPDPLPLPVELMIRQTCASVT